MSEHEALKQQSTSSGARRSGPFHSPARVSPYLPPSSSQSSSNLTTPSRSDRAALLFAQAGAFAVVLVALPYKAFDLDRYFVPKELALHVTALGAALLCLRGRPRVTLARLDWLLIAFLGISTVSAVFADNWWLAGRALAISFSGVALFWVARTLRQVGLGRALLWAVALAAAAGAVTSLLQAYGIDSEFFSLNRSPGGTFGNRNFMAHLGAIAAPVILYCGLTARGRLGSWLAWCALGTVAATQVLSRSRAAWLALVACAVPIVLLAWIVRGRWITPETRPRLSSAGLVALVGVLTALMLPNTLEWRSDSPYLESVRGMVNYQEGSGRGRLVQYNNSLRMTLDRPLLGVGPGNWSVEYPRYASRNDPSISNADEGLTSNPWPSSDWIAFLAERGAVATAALALTLVALLILAAWNLKGARSVDSVLAALALGGTVIATLVVGALDAVLLLATPTLFVWMLLGVFSEPPSSAAARQPLDTKVRRWLPAGVALLGLLAIARSGLQIAAMGLYSTTTRTSVLERASLFDPGSYRIKLRLASTFLASGRCERVRSYARDAHDLYASAEEPRRLLASCGVQVARPKKR